MSTEDRETARAIIDTDWDAAEFMDECYDRLEERIAAALAAARREGIEAAAQACRERAGDWLQRAIAIRERGGDDGEAESYQDAANEAQQCAAAIRALT
jgi:hypothetical protein